MLGGRKPNIKVGGDFGTVPSDKYTVQIADVNFKTRFNKWKNEDAEGLNFQFVILDEKEDAEGETTRNRYLWHFMSQSLSSRSWLMKLAKAVYGRDLTKDELDPKSPKFFNPEDLIGKQVDVLVTEDPSKDGTATFNNISSYSKTIKPLEPIALERSKQAVVEAESSPVTVDLPNLNPELDKFLEDVSKDEEKSEEVEEVAEESDEESLEELEAKIKLAKAKAKKAKETK
jgi:hypothetical protein